MTLAAAPLALSSLTIYPVKSCAGISLDHSRLEPRGLADDRRWLVVDGAGKGLTGRSVPRLLCINARIDKTSMTLEAPGMDSVRIDQPRTHHDPVEVEIWRDRVDASRVSDAADRWLREFLQITCSLVHMPASSLRQVDPSRSLSGDVVSFADAFPLLLIADASLHDLNARLRAPVSMARFRPNLTVSGSAAYAEDRWTRVRIGDVDFDVADTCDRCVMTTIDPHSGTRDPQRQPLKTLADYRRDPDKGIPFGVNLIPRGAGALRLGDPVQLLD